MDRTHVRMYDAGKTVAWDTNMEERHSLVLWRGFGTWLIMNPCIF